MRRSTRLTVPVSLITTYYLVVIGGFLLLSREVPEVRSFLPVGGLEDLLERADDTFEPVSSGDFSEEPWIGIDSIELALAMVGVGILMVPISWVYFMTTRDRDIDASFVQTIIILPIVVTGVAHVVQHSLALAFSLAGVVAAVRFRLSLSNPADALYIFAAIGIGLGAGIGALGVGAVISVAFVYTTVILWRIHYGESLNGRFIAFLTGRDRAEDQDY